MNFSKGAIKKGKGKFVVHAKSKLSIDPVAPPTEVLIAFTSCRKV